jgi:hypothetical protein
MYDGFLFFSTICRLMEMVLADIVWSQCLLYWDNNLTFGKDFKTACINLRAVFERLRQANLKLNLRGNGTTRRKLQKMDCQQLEMGCLVARARKGQAEI